MKTCICWHSVKEHSAAGCAHVKCLCRAFAPYNADAEKLRYDNDYLIDRLEYLAKNHALAVQSALETQAVLGEENARLHRRVAALEAGLVALRDSAASGDYDGDFVRMFIGRLL